MSGRVFVDTNVLVYAHDRDAGERHERARALVRRLWQDRSGVVSTQVLQEFYVNVRRKARQPISRPQAHRVLTDYLAWEVIVNDGDSILAAVDLESRYQLSFWDALIVVSNFRERVVPRTEIESVTWEAGCGVSLKMNDGKWVKLPDYGHNAQGMTNSIRA